MDNIDLIDLTVDNRPRAFSDDEDAAAFGTKKRYRRLYRDEIWRLKHNDPNFCLLALCGELTDAVCARIGVYLWSSQHIKNVSVDSCGITSTKMKLLFGKIASQNQTNQYVGNEDILGKLGVHETSLHSNIIESLTSLTHLVNVNVSDNEFGTDGLDVLVKALAGTPIGELDVINCGIEDINPLKGLRKCHRLKNLNISNNSFGGNIAIDVVSVLFDNNHPKLRDLNINGCGIRDDFLELASPILKGNKSMRYLNMHSNEIRRWGLEMIRRAVHDSSSFAKTLASNHTIWKISLGQFTGDQLFELTRPNYMKSGRGPSFIAWEKYIDHLAKNEDADMSPFMDLNIKIIPQLLYQCSNYMIYSNFFGLEVIFKIWSCKMFRGRIESVLQFIYLKDKYKTLNAKVRDLEMAQATEKERTDRLIEKNTNQATEIESLQEQIAKLLQTQDNKPSWNREETKMTSSSIAQRVKARQSTKKRGRKSLH